MKKLSIQKVQMVIRICFISLITVIISLFLFSFTVNRFSEEFLSQLGISKTEADKKITNSLLGGYLDGYGLRNAKNIVLGNRAAVVKDLVIYGKQYVNSAAFIKEYEAIRANAKPKMKAIQTPDEMQQQMVEQYRKSVADIEKGLKAADASMKKVYEEMLATTKAELKKAEDPNNEMAGVYRSNYETMVEMEKTVYENEMEQWRNAYPSNHLLYVKTKLQQFMDETAGIDFNAQLTEKNGKRYFVNSVYERKGNRWKMAFRAGKEPVESARQQVQQWINEIK